MVNKDLEGSGRGPFRSRLLSRHSPLRESSEQQIIRPKFESDTSWKQIQSLTAIPVSSALNSWHTDPSAIGTRENNFCLLYESNDHTKMHSVIQMSYFKGLIRKFSNQLQATLPFAPFLLTQFIWKALLYSTRFHDAKRGKEVVKSNF